MKKVFLITGLLLMTLLLLVSCGGKEEDRSYENGVKVVYHLEGGSYKNSTRPVTQYYAFQPGTENKIMAPDELTGYDITRPSFRFLGWYTQRTGEGEDAVYTGKWDFEKDKVEVDQEKPSNTVVTLYASWERIAKYTFDLYYKDANGNDVMLYENIPARFNKPVSQTVVGFVENMLKNRGKTCIGWTDAEGNAWDLGTPHPGGETDTCIRLYAKYIDGVYSVVNTAEELESALKPDANGKVTNNIYLAQDIDFGGGDFAGFGHYTGHIIGNGYKIFNFNLTYSTGKSDIVPDAELSPGGEKVAQISLFKKLDGAKIEDVTFEYSLCVSFEIQLANTKVVIAPLAMKMQKSTLDNVTATATYTVGDMPNGFDLTQIAVGNVAAWFMPTDDTSVTTDVTVTITETVVPQPEPTPTPDDNTGEQPDPTPSEQ